MTPIDGLSREPRLQRTRVARRCPRPIWVSLLRGAGRMPRAGSTLETSGDTCGADAVRCIKAPGRTATARSCGCTTERPRHAQRTARALRQRPGGPASLVGCDQRGGAPALSCRRDGALAAHGAAALGWEEASRLRHETLGWTAIKEGLLGGTFSVSPRSELEEARLHVAGASTRTPAFAPRSESGRAERATCSARKAGRRTPAFGQQARCPDQTAPLLMPQREAGPGVTRVACGAVETRPRRQPGQALHKLRVRARIAG